MKIVEVFSPQNLSFTLPCTDYNEISCFKKKIFCRITDVPKLLPHPGLEKKEEEEEEEDYEEGAERKPLSKKKVKSGPRTPDPYASDNSSLMFPILVAFGVFIPTLFCLCRL